MQNKLYQAYVSTDISKKPAFILSEVPVEKIYKGELYKTKTEWPCKNGERTMFFGPGGFGKLEEQMCYTEHILLYYSANREKCLCWLKDKRTQMIDQMVRFTQELDQSKIEER